MSTSSGQPMIELNKKENATPPQEKEALTKESKEANKEGEKEVLTPPQVRVPFPQRLKDKSED